MGCLPRAERGRRACALGLALCLGSGHGAAQDPRRRAAELGSRYTRPAAVRALRAAGTAAVPALTEVLLAGTAPEEPAPWPTGERIVLDGSAEDPRRLLPSPKWCVRPAAALHRAPGHDEPPCRVAAWLLGKIGDARALPALARAARDVDQELRCRAVEALARLGAPAAAALGGALGYEISGRRAASALAEAGRAAVPAVCGVLHSGSGLAQADAMAALAWMAPAGAVEALPDLIAQLCSADRQRAALAARVLSRADARAVPSVMQLLFSPRPEMRRRATGVLALIGAPAGAAGQLLVDQLAAEDELLVRWSAVALGEIWLEPEVAARAVQALHGLDGKAPYATRLVALDSLARLARAAAPAERVLATQALVGAVASGEGRLRDKALALLGLLGTEGGNELATDCLIGVLRGGDDAAQARAAAALGRLGAGARDAVPDLAAALESPHNRLRAAAARALGQIGPAAAAVLPALRKAARDPVPSVAGHAQRAVRRVSAAAGAR